MQFSLNLPRGGRSRKMIRFLFRAGAGSFSERHGRETDGGAELTGEGGLVTVTAAEGDFYNR